jgi:hypothetical protein
MASEVKIAYDKSDLRGIARAFKAMSEEATDAAKKESSNLAEYASQQIKIAAANRTVSGIAAQRVADGVRISKSSKIGEFSYGFAGQKFSGGGSTRILWGPMEFGSKKFKQFPVRSPRLGAKGNEGYFIFPTLRRIQPQIVAQWEEAFSKILKEWT